MSNNLDPRTELNRLRTALEALSEDLDAMERRPHISLRLAAASLEGIQSTGLEAFVNHFAAAIKRGTV